MLDLNCYVSSGDSMAAVDSPADSVAQIDDSGASKSSIVDAEEAAAPSCHEKEQDSSDAGTGFIFEIIRRKKESVSSELATEPLFPVAGERRDWDSELRLGLSTLARSPSENLSFSYSGAGVKDVKRRRGPRSRSSQYRGVTFYRRTGRWESHIWDCGKQVYLGGFDTAHAAARAYDRAAIKFRGTDADINFNTSDYEEDINQTKNLTKEEFVYVLRRHCSRFSRGRSNSEASTLRKCGRLEKNDDNDLDLSLGISKNSIGNTSLGFMNCRFNGGDELNAYRKKGNLIYVKLGKNCSFFDPGTSNLKQKLIEDTVFQMDGSDPSRVDEPRRQPQTGAVVSDQTSIFSSFRGFHQPSSSSASRTWRGMVSPVPIFTIAASSGFSSFAAHHHR